MVKEIAKELFYEVIEELVVPMSRNFIQAAQHYLGLSTLIYTDMETDTVRHLAKYA